MPRSTTKCEIRGCRNVGRVAFTLITETAGEFICETDTQYPVCKKHLIQAIEEACARQEDGMSEQ